MNASSIPDTVITRLSPLAVCLRVACVAAMLFALWYAALYPRGDATKDIFESRVFWVISLIFTPTLLWIEWVTLRQMIFQQSRAVWIESGRLKFIDDRSLRHHFRSLEIADIQELSLGSSYLLNTWWRLPYVTIKLKSGGNGGSILTLYFTDSAKVVLARLSEALPLPKTP